jgi:hypothetical protein
VIKEYATTILLWLSIIVGELHTFWDEHSQMKEVDGRNVEMVLVDGKWVDIKKYNWVLTRDESMTLQWNVKLVAGQVASVFIFLSICLYRRNRINTTTVHTFFIISMVDLGMWFYNFKTYHYGFIYILLLLIWIIIYNTYGRYFKTTIRQGMDDKVIWADRKAIGNN